MKYKKIQPLVLILLLLTSSLCYSCADKKKPKEEDVKENNKIENSAESGNVSADEKKKKVGEVAKVPAKVNASPCDPDLWKHVYNPRRLKVLDKCLTVTGVIKKSKANEDGDQHMYLKLNPGQDHLLRKKNKKLLTIEAVCVNKITDRKVGAVCKGYVNQVQLPNVGDHVKVTGTYVLDTHNGWTEIHPISTIVVIK